MSESSRKPYFAGFEDLVRVYVGPFASFRELIEHVQFCDARGDAAEVVHVCRDRSEVPEGYDVITPEADRAQDTNTLSGLSSKVESAEKWRKRHHPETGE